MILVKGVALQSTQKYLLKKQNNGNIFTQNPYRTASFKQSVYFKKLI